MKKTFSKYVVLAIFAGSVMATGCDYLEAETSRIDNIEAPAENSILLCSDGLDNDKDGLADCDDPDCKLKGTAVSPGPGDTICAGIIGNNATENNNYVCADGKDNDGDGFVDCNDNSCKQLSVCCIKTGDENTVEACSDGIDNDCNGYIDCKDYSCSKAADAAVKAYCASVNCPTGVSPEDTPEACSDGIDNDCNGYIDCGDYSCTKHPDQAVKDVCAAPPPASPENTEMACSDGVDNNLDGLIDCAEASCRDMQYCAGIVAEPAPRDPKFGSFSQEEKIKVLQLEQQLCTDGIDNDKDSLVDCQEYQCHLLSQQKLTGEFAQYQITCN